MILWPPPISIWGSLHAKIPDEHPPSELQHWWERVKSSWAGGTLDLGTKQRVADSVS